VRIPGSRRRSTVVVNETNPLAAAMVAALDVGNGLRLAGRAGGALRIGLTGSRAVSYAGDLGPLQQFRGYAGPASGQANKRTGGPMALPMTGAPDPLTGIVKGRK
jgi:hypothetical protein